MSWWPVPDCDGAVTGDAAVDAVDGAVKALAHKPELPEFVAALDAELRAASRDLVSDPERLGTVVVPGARAAPEAPAGLRTAIHDALRGLTAAYERAFERRPTLTEPLDTFTFSLGGVAAERLSGPLPARIEFTVA